MDIVNHERAEQASCHWENFEGRRRQVQSNMDPREFYESPMQLCATMPCVLGECSMGVLSTAVGQEFKAQEFFLCKRGHSVLSRSIHGEAANCSLTTVRPESEDKTN